uniref:MOFRL domain-containing protein n=1 Tax=Glossina austeni TaxID=7395 RepID=A0A1A9UIZ1_GLOAU
MPRRPVDLKEKMSLILELSNRGASIQELNSVRIALSFHVLSALQCRVKGSGLGGRNQELSLRLSKIFFEDPQLKNVFFLSAGTDGIDGPTDAAGAVGCHHVIQDFLDQNNNECLIGFKSV